MRSQVVSVHLIDVDWPEFGIPEERPPVSRAEFERRLEAARAGMRELGLSHLLVYGDREHSANLLYLSGYDPRFEEALLVLGTERGGRPVDPPRLLVGNEGLGYIGVSPLVLEVELFQPFSLIGQDRSRSRPLVEILRHAGLASGQRVGTVGWKYELGGDGQPDRSWLEIPAFLIEAVRHTGAEPFNATDLLMHPGHGLRARCSAPEIAALEFAATRTSESVKRLLFGLHPGQREYEAARAYQADGLPLCCHPMVSVGEKARLGLSSPSDRRIERGEPITAAFGVWGSLTARAGMVAEGPEELRSDLREFYPGFAMTYYGAVRTWYEALALGRPGAEVVSAVAAATPADVWTAALNPGHLIHTDEWVSTPFFVGSQVPLSSGMALQMDIIPVSAGRRSPASPFCVANAEDGVVLADETLRAELASRHPEVWKRVQARHQFMREVLGVRLRPEVLPLGNTPGLFSPYFLNPRRVCCAGSFG
jgi:hypothetical protein